MALHAYPQTIVFQDPEEHTALTTRVTSFKTPARSVKRHRPVHDENSVYGHPHLTGKKALLFKTPGRAIATDFKSRVITDKQTATATKSVVLSEITNKTPFIKGNNARPPPSLKPAKAFVIFEDPQAEVSPRISSTRKSLRLPHSASKNFQTPETAGNHWDVSEVSMEASVQEEVSEVHEDYDEVEYMPPSVTEPIYEPEFEMPDYTRAGRDIKALFPHMMLPEHPSPERPNFFDQPEYITVLDNIELPDLSDDAVSPYAFSKRKTAKPTSLFIKHKQMPSDTSLIPSRIPKPSHVWFPRTRSTKGFPPSRIPVLSKLQDSKPDRDPSPLQPVSRPKLHPRGVSMSVPGNSGKTHSRTKSLPQNVIREAKLYAVREGNSAISTRKDSNQKSDKDLDDDGFGLAARNALDDCGNDDFLFSI
ncbi:hypothetical protein M422DRAFT_246611 [Sphaerobolus stellatus SS14]|nr:hypothetical protein M422DRAFT_246611 [Sphaerobolus stellatus SS14]